MKSSEIDAVMREAVGRGVFPSAALLAARGETVLHQGFYGEAQAGTLFDIASLTKPVATTTLMMLAVREGRLALADPLAERLAAITQPAHRRITLGHLLSHTAGLPPWRPYHREIPQAMIGTPAAKGHILSAILQEPLSTPSGKLCEYSDLGFILLGFVLEQTYRQPLDHLFEEKIARPLGLQNTFFVPLSEKEKFHGRRFAPTEDCPWRGKVVRGEVHDPVAYCLGGVAGHAGLFSTCADIHLFATALLAAFRGDSGWLKPETVRAFLDPPESPSSTGHGTFLYGWNTPSFSGSSAGRRFPPRSIGHLGYTGCTVWIDLDKAFSVILLSNRIHPSDSNIRIRSFRPRLHNLLYKTFVG